MSATNRTSRRATTSGLIVRDNHVFEIRLLVDGYGKKRSTHYYRRHTARCLYTGPAPIGSVYGLVRSA